jgi:hypothetical protein
MEVFLFIGIVVALLLWPRYYKAIFQVHSFRPNRMHKVLLAILPVLCMLLVVAVLWKWSSPDVRSDPEWIALYAVGGAAWLQLGLYLLSLFGISAREDVLERQNPSAAWVVYGALTGTALCYTGANVGNGPGAEVVLFCAGLSTLCLFGFWFCLERIFRLTDRVTIERDESAGIRIGGWILSLGLIFGAAVAGDWESLEGALRDFIQYAWVSLLFMLAAVLAEYIFKISRKQENLPRSVSFVIAAGYLLAAAIYVLRRGIH